MTRVFRSVSRLAFPLVFLLFDHLVYFSVCLLADHLAFQLVALLASIDADHRAAQLLDCHVCHLSYHDSPSPLAYS